MSRNFELLSQLETDFEFGGKPGKNVRTCVRAAEHEVSPAFPQELLSLAQTMFLSGDAEVPHSVVFCGVDCDSASTAICVDVGRILVASGAGPVCLVDAHPEGTLERLLTPDSSPALSGCVRGGSRQVTSNLWLAEIDTARLPKQEGTVSAMKQHIAELQEKFEFVLIAAPGIGLRAEAAMLGQLADGVLLVVEANVTRKAAALKARNTLEAAHVRILGSVLNNRVFPIPERIYRRL